MTATFSTFPPNLSRQIVSRPASWRESRDWSSSRPMKSSQNQKKFVFVILDFLLIFKQIAVFDAQNNVDTKSLHKLN